MNRFEKLRFKDVYDLNPKPVSTLANELGVAPNTIKNAEKGDIKPGFDTLKAYHNILGVSYDYLFDEEGKCPARQSQNAEISKDLQLSDNAIDTLRAIRNEKNPEQDILSLMNALLDDKEVFLSLFTSLYRQLYHWKNETGNYKTDSLTYKDATALLKFYINEEIGKYIIDTVVPKMEQSFKNCNDSKASNHDDLPPDNSSVWG